MLQSQLKITLLTLNCVNLLSFSSGIWDRVVQQVAKLRDESAMLKLFTDHVKGEEMYGLTVHAVMRITESVRMSDYIISVGFIQAH